MYIILTCCVVATLATYALSRLAMPIGLRTGLMDVPGARKAHAAPTPLMGGLVILSVIVPLCAILILQIMPPEHAHQFIGYLCAVAAITILGLLDDLHSIAPRPRMLIALAIFFTLGALVPQFNVRYLTFGLFDINLGFGYTSISLLFTTACILVFINAVNMADGKNGVVIGLCAGWIALLMVRMPHSLQILAAVILCVLLPLLYFNLRGRLFLGDGGAYGFGALVGLLAISTYNVAGPYHGRSLTAEEVVVLFIVPLIDSLRVMTLRLSKGLSPFDGDRNHLHHLLQAKLAWPYNLFAYWGLALGPAAALIISAPFLGT